MVAAKGDNLILSVDPHTFQSAVQSGNNVVLSFSGGTVTITDGTLDAGGLPYVYLQGGTFSQAGSANQVAPLQNSNVLAYLTDSTTANTYVGTSADSKIAIFGGRGQFDGNDGNDTIGIGGKGSFLMHGNAGADTITQTMAFDSTSVVNVYGDAGNDSIVLAASNSKASIFVSAGESADVVTVVNSGTTTIFGGLDSADGNDTITFNGVSGKAGTSVIFGNGGADSITIGGVSNQLDSTSTTTVYGGFDNDKITATANGATVNVLGGEGADTINVTNHLGGTTYIAGGNQSGDQGADSADQITFTGSGNALVYGNVGNDTITLNLEDSVAANVSVYGGKDNDLITVNQTHLDGGTAKSSVFVAGGEGLDTISVVGNGGAVTIYGGINSSDATDSADVITYSGSGTANIFGNGGADSITIGTLGGADSTNAQVNVSGGAGADSIYVGAQGFNQQALNISGNDGADTFQIASGAGRNVTITDLAVSGTAADTLKITGAGTAGTLGLVGDTFTNDQLQAALNAAATKAGASTNAAAGFSNVAAVRVGSDTYVVIENSGPGFDPTTDQAIKLTGVSDLAGLQGHTTITGNILKLTALY